MQNTYRLCITVSTENLSPASRRTHGWAAWAKPSNRIQPTLLHKRIYKNQPRLG